MMMMTMMMMGVRVCVLTAVNPAIDYWCIILRIMCWRFFFMPIGGDSTGKLIAKNLSFHLHQLLFCSPYLHNLHKPCQIQSGSLFNSYHSWQLIIFAIFTITALGSFHLLSLVQSFILNLRLGSLANPFHHIPLPHLYRTDSTDYQSDHLTFLFCSMSGFVCNVRLLSQLSVHRHSQGDAGMQVQISRHSCWNEAKMGLNLVRCTPADEIKR